MFKNPTAILDSFDEIAMIVTWHVVLNPHLEGLAFRLEIDHSMWQAGVPVE